MKTELIIIADRSGSMLGFEGEATNGINDLIKKQAKEKGKCDLTLVQFDTEYEVVENGTEIKKVREYTLIPRGATALNDAIGKTILDTRRRLKKKKRLVLCAIVTDGGENSSQEFKPDQVKKLIKEQEEAGWHFTYIGANQDAFATGHLIGVAAGNTANYKMSKTTEVYGTLNKKFATARAAAATGQAVDMSYTPEERHNLSSDETSP